MKSGVLHYRLFVEVEDDRRVVEKKATEQLYSWLRQKKLDADALLPGTEVQLGPRSRGSIAFSDRQDGSRSMRSVVIDENPAGRWTTSLTIDVPGNERRKPWLWLDLHGPEGVRGAIPGLARSLLEVFEAKTDDIRQGEAQPITARSDVGSLVETACNPNRRGIIFVAGSDSQLSFDQWLRYVRKLLRECVGLAGGYVLSPEATKLFNNAIGPVHRVEPWTLRSFYPGVMPDDANDGRRHKVLGRDRIINDRTHWIARMLGSRAREATLDTPLPSLALRVDRIFEQIFDQTLLEGLDSREQEPTGSASLADEVQIGATSVSVDDPVLGALEKILGGGPLTVDRVLALGELVALGRRAQENRAAISKRLEDYEQALVDERENQRDLRSKLDDTQLEYAIAEDARAAAEAEVRRLQKLLIVSNRSGEVWGSESKEAEEARPSDCDELASRINFWTRVKFTGDKDRLRELDEHEKLGAWAGRIWDALAVLDDYARAILEGQFSGDVHHYLGNTPPGFRTYSQKNHAQDESEQVRANRRFHNARVFAVPRTVDPSGKIFMGAHFKIAKYAMITPRLHYYNDVRVSGLVYVGYIGRHLPNGQTN